MAEFKIREGGRNGSVEVTDKALIRSLKKRLGKNDVQTIPLKGITSVHHDRKITRSDKVLVQAGVVTYEWKVSKADEFVSLVNQKLMDL